jgi:hypothetical protein
MINPTLALATLALLLAVAVAPLRAADQPGPPDACAPHIATPPKLDGTLKDPVWKTLATTHVGALGAWHDLGGNLISQQRLAFVCWDDQNFYIGMQAFTPDIYALASADNPFLADCLEVHFKLPSGDYYQFAIDIDGNIGLGVAPPGTEISSLRGATEFGDDDWTAELAIPWKILGVTPHPGLRFGFNLAANRAYQGNNAWAAITWGKSFFVKHYETVLELQ